MIRVALVRGAYLNSFEGQNYSFDAEAGIKIIGISSFFPLDERVSFPVKRLFSPLDLYNNRVFSWLGRGIKYIANRTIGDPQMLFGLEKAVTDFDVVHTADPTYYYSYQLACLRKSKRIRCLVSTSWETIPYNNESTQAKRRMKRFVQANTDMFLCYTEKAKSALLKEGVASEKISVIPLGVDLRRFKAIPRENIDTFIFVGRLVKEKGIQETLQAFEQVHEKYPHVRLLIVGKGPLEGELKRFSGNKGLTDSVRFTNSFYHDMPEMYRRAGIFVVPSITTDTWEEQYGMVFVEALAGGFPIITTRSGAIPEVVGDCGVYVSEQSVSGLVEAMGNLLNNEADRQKFGTMSRRRAEKMFDSRKTAKCIKTLYQSLIHQ